MNLKKLQTLAMFLVVGFTIKAQLKEVGGFQNPESVVAYGDKLFVSNLGVQLDPTAKDGDGFISILSRKDGKMLEDRFLTGLNSPKGMLVCCGEIIIADVDRVVVYNIKTRKKTREADLSKFGVTYANDLVMKCGGVFVSSTDKNAIYKACRSGKVKQMAIKGELPGANGLASGCGKLYVANYGRGETPDGSFGKLNRCNKNFTAYQTGGAYDGIIKVCGRLVVTDWVVPAENKGRVVVYRICKKKLSEVNVGRTIDGPADLYADRKTKTIWIPAMRENKLLGLSFDAIKK